MYNDLDLSQIEKQIQGNAANAASARRQAENYRINATQKAQDGGQNDAAYYDQEARRLDQQATELEDQIDQLRTAKEYVEQRIHDLEDQRSRVNSDHSDRLSQIDNELAKLRG